MIKRDHDAYFSAAHAAKDSGIALKLGEQQQLEMVLAKATYQQYQRLTDLGLGLLDKSGIAELTFLERMPKGVHR
jgi:3-hydroxyisobutyrate dehydrogenase